MTIRDKQFEQQTYNKMHNAKRRSNNLWDLTSTSVSGEIFKTKRKKTKQQQKPPTQSTKQPQNMTRERTEIVGRVTKKKKRRKCSER